MGSLSLQVTSIAFSLEPPIPITRTDYICDKCFHLDAIKALYHEQPYYAVIMLTARSSELWLVNDLHKKKISGIDLSLTNSHKKGGQSQARFDRLFQNKRDHNDSFLIEAIIDTYYDFSTNKPKVVGFIIGGHAETRIRVGKELDILDDYIVCNIACEHLDVYHLWNASRQYRDDFILSKSTRVITEIEELIRTTPEMLDFGVEVEKAIGHNIYSKVYSGKEISITSKCQIITVDPAWIGQYGHFIGVRFMSEE
jgi:peptide subunit release factor 1 (eRF1)